MNSSREDHEPGHGAATASDATLDAEITLLPVLDHLESHIPSGRVNRLVDLGCGHGIGTVELAKRFPAATVIAIDVSPAMLESASNRVEDADLSNRVEFLLGDFDVDLCQLLEPVDLVWASLSLHHTTDSASGLRNAVKLVAPGGRIVVNEFGAELRVWPEASPVTADGVWVRFGQALATSRIDHLGHDPSSTNWEELLNSLRLSEVGATECQILHSPVLSSRERRWLTRYLRRAVDRCASYMEAQDVLVIEELLDSAHPEGIELSTDISIEMSRMLYTGVRASGSAAQEGKSS